MRRIFFSFFLFIMVTIAILDFGVSPVVNKIVERHLSQQVNDYWREVVKGPFHMMILDLERMPEAQWAQRIENLQPHFSYPIRIQPYMDAGLTPEEQAQVLNKEVVVKQNGELFFLRVGETPFLLSMGPINEPQLDLLHYHVIIWVVLLIILALLALIWALPFGHKLQRIITAAVAFGDGHLTTRARVPSRSSLAPLAFAFNRMADRIQELINTQRELTNAVSHELRTPIARTRFSLEMLGTATKIGDRKHYLAEISKDIDELDALVSESLTYARFDQERLEIDWQPRALETWLRQIAKSALPPHLLVVFECRNRLSPHDREIYCDPRYMARAIGNLIQNAAKHAHSRVEVTLEEKGGACCIHVDDDGAGIAEADRTKVFQAFTRLDDSRSRASGGHGLGLAIVRRVVTWHGGRIWVEQAPLGGARLTLCWPGFTPSVQGEGAGDEAE